MAGMAIDNPTSVVNKAVEIPWANSDGLGVVGLREITLKDLIIPYTVPSSPVEPAKASEASEQPQDAERPTVGVCEHVNARTEDGGGKDGRDQEV